MTHGKYPLPLFLYISLICWNVALAGKFPPPKKSAGNPGTVVKPRRLARRGCGGCGPHEIRQELMETLSRLGRPRPRWKFWLHPWKINGWNMSSWRVGKMIFLSKWVIYRFHVNFPGCMEILRGQYGKKDELGESILGHEDDSENSAKRLTFKRLSKIP